MASRAKLGFAVRRGDCKTRLNPSFFAGGFQALLTWLGTVPSIRPLGELIAEGGFGVLPPGNSYLPEGGIRFLRPTEMREGNEVDWHACLRAPTEFGRHERARVVTGDILLAVKGATIAAEKSVCLIDELTEPTIVNGSIFRFQPKRTEASGEFLLEVLSSSIARRQMKGAMILNNAVDYLSRDVIDQLLLPIPSTSIQSRLVRAMAAARAARREKLAQADSLLGGLDAFVLDQLGLTLPPPDGRTAYAVRLRDGLHERADANFHTPRFREIQRRLQSLGAVPLGTLCRLSEERADPTVGDGPTFRYIEISSVNSETGEAQPVDTLRSAAPSRARMVVRDGNIIVSLTRPQRGSIALIDESLDGCIASTGFAVLADINTDEVQTSYLWSFLRTQAARLQMLQKSSGGNYPAITEDELHRVLVPVPDANVQGKIAAEVVRRREEARRLREDAARLWDDAKRHFEEELLGLGRF